MKKLASFLWIYTNKCPLKKGQTKRSAASLMSFQLQIEVTVLAVLAPLNNSVLTREHIFYARRNPASLPHCQPVWQWNISTK
jgi:hypothetical protein